jgi:hypothetical protein
VILRSSTGKETVLLGGSGKAGLALQLKSEANVISNGYATDANLETEIYEWVAQLPESESCAYAAKLWLKK